MLEIIINIILKTGIIVVPLFFCGMVGWYYAVEIFLFSKEDRNKPAVTLYEFEEMISNNDYKRLEERVRFQHSVSDKFLMQIVRYNKERRAVLTMKCREIILENITSRYQALSSIRVFAAAAPLLGLLGTVNGMITTFNIISFYGNSNPILMADGISEALLTTQAGLIVAFPLMFVHVLLRNRLNDLKNRLDAYYLKFCNIKYLK